MFINVLGYHTRKGKLMFGLHLMIQRFRMTLMLQKRVSVDPWKLPDSLFGPNYHTLYPLYCLEAGVWENLLWHPFDNSNA